MHLYIQSSIYFDHCKLCMYIHAQNDKHTSVIDASPACFVLRTLFHVPYDRLCTGRAGQHFAIPLPCLLFYCCNFLSGLSFNSVSPSLQTSFRSVQRHYLFSSTSSHRWPFTAESKTPSRPVCYGSPLCRLRGQYIGFVNRSLLKKSILNAFCER